MNSFKESLGGKDKYFGINPSKAARIARWNAIKDGISKEWQKFSVPRVLTAAAVAGSIVFGGVIAHQSLTARSINKGTELDSMTTRRLVNEAMDRKADRIATGYIKKYNLKGKVAKGLRNYVEYEVEKTYLKSKLSYLDARAKRIILNNIENERLENEKKREIKPETVAVKVNASPDAKKQIKELEESIEGCNAQLKELRKKRYEGMENRRNPKTAKRIEELSFRIESFRKQIYELDPSRKPAAISTELQQVKTAETTQTLTGTVTWSTTYEFPISKSYEADKLSKEAIQRYTNDTKISDFERYTFTDMCNFPFSVVRIENGRFSCFILVPHIAFRDGDKVTLSMRTLPGRSISYQQIIDQTLGKGYKAMQTADVKAEYIAVESKRTD